MIASIAAVINGSFWVLSLFHFFLFYLLLFFAKTSRYRHSKLRSKKMSINQLNPGVGTGCLIANGTNATYGLPLPPYEYSCELGFLCENTTPTNPASLPVYCPATPKCQLERLFWQTCVLYSFLLNDSFIATSRTLRTCYLSSWFLLPNVQAKNYMSRRFLLSFWKF
jgi:hypothetical protein